MARAHRSAISWSFPAMSTTTRSASSGERISRSSPPSPLDSLMSTGVDFSVTQVVNTVLGVHAAVPKSSFYAMNGRQADQ